MAHVKDELSFQARSFGFITPLVRWIAKSRQWELRHGIGNYSACVMTLWCQGHGDTTSGDHGSTSHAREQESPQRESRFGSASLGRHTSVKSGSDFRFPMDRSGSFLFEVLIKRIDFENRKRSEQAAGSGKGRD